MYPSKGPCPNAGIYHRCCRRRSRRFMARSEDVSRNGNSMSPGRGACAMRPPLTDQSLVASATDAVDRTWSADSRTACVRAVVLASLILNRHQRLRRTLLTKVSTSPMSTTQTKDPKNSNSLTPPKLPLDTRYKLGRWSLMPPPENQNFHHRDTHDQRSRGPR